MRVENWNGYDIRFVEKDGEWYAILKDICDALGLRSSDVSQRLDSDMMIKIKVDRKSTVANANIEDEEDQCYRFDTDSNVVNSRGAKTFHMIAVNEMGIYEALYASRKLEARKFRKWSASVMQKLRRKIGLEQYEVMRMTDKDIQDEIDYILDSIYYDEKTGKLMQSVTVAGGDVEQIEFK